MADLGPFQRAFADALLAPAVSEAAFEPGFAVYRNTVARGAVEALRAAYPTVDLLVGEDMFTQVALDYRAGHPPLSPVLSDYGADFAGFLASQPWSTGLPYLADVARIDRLWLECFLAIDWRPPQSCTAGEPRIRLNPATRFCWLDTPAMTIWLAHRQPGGVELLEPEWRGEGALFARRAMAIEAEPIDAACYSLLEASRATTSLNACAELVAQRHPEADPFALIDRCCALGALIIL